MQYHKLTTNSPFYFEAGGMLPSIDIVYHTSPHQRRDGERVIWICHALTANSDAEDWWPQMVGPGKFIDTDENFVVCVNTIGSPYGTSSPVSIDPSTGLPYYFNFPAYTVKDMAATFTIVRKHLGIESVDLLIGSSIGGFHALEWAVMEQNVIKKAAFMATAPVVSPWISASTESQRMALEADQTFRACKDLHGGSKGLECARAQALISYRCFEGYGLTQKEDNENFLFSSKAASYQRHQGQKLVNRNFDAYSYWALCNSVDSHNLGRGRGGVDAALGCIKAECVVVSIDTDGLFPPSEGKQWGYKIPGAKYKIIESKFGHDGFLLEYDQLKEIISSLCRF